MDAEDEEVGGERKQDETGNTCEEVFDKVDGALGDIAKMGPEVESSEGSNIEDDEEADKLDRDGSSKAYTKNNQPTEIECDDFFST